MKTVAFSKAAKVLVEKCAGIKNGNQVLTPTDFEYPQGIPKAIFNAAFAAGAEAVVFTMVRRESSGTLHHMMEEPCLEHPKTRLR
jgi:hypothetical protein